MGSIDQSEGSIRAVGQSEGRVTDPGDGLINFIKSRRYRDCDQVKHWDESDIIVSGILTQIIKSWMNEEILIPYHSITDKIFIYLLLINFSLVELWNAPGHSWCILSLSPTRPKSLKIHQDIYTWLGCRQSQVQELAWMLDLECLCLNLTWI